MKKVVILFGIVLAFSLAGQALSAPKKSSTGVACNSTGSERKDGKDQDGNKMNCQWDTCTYCGKTSGVIDCSKQITEYSNPTDCHAAAAVNNGNQSLKLNGDLKLKADPAPRPGKKGLSNAVRKGGMKASP